jgi:hypothetical protein
MTSLGLWPTTLESHSWLSSWYLRHTMLSSLSVVVSYLTLDSRVTITDPQNNYSHCASAQNAKPTPKS